MKKQSNYLMQWIVLKDYYGSKSNLFTLSAGATSSLLLYLAPINHSPIYLIDIFFSFLSLTYINWLLLYLFGSRTKTPSAIKWARTISFSLAINWTGFLTSIAYYNKVNSDLLNLVVIYNIALLSVWPYVFRFDRVASQVLTVVSGVTLLFNGYFQYEKTAYFFIFISGSIIYTAFIWNSSRSRYYNDLKLINDQRRLEQIVDAFPGGVSLLKNLNYEVINKYIKLQIPDSHLMLGKELGFLESNKEWSDKIKQFAISDENELLYEKEIQTKKGLRTHLTAATKISKEELVVISIDIEDLVQAKKEVEVQKAKNIANAKLVSLGEMGAGIAHEINNPLAVLKGRIHLLEKALGSRPPDPEKVQHNLSKIMPMILRIEKIVNSMRNLSHGGDSSAEMSSLSVRQLIEESLVFMEARLKNYGVTINIEGGALDKYILGIESELIQVMVNALANSHDAIQKLDTKWITLSAELVNNFIQIKVVDSGKGIPLENRNKIGQPFFTTKAPGKGTGLGLSISNTIIQKHSGLLFFDHGQPHTTLIIQLPEAPNPQS